MKRKVISTNNFPSSIITLMERSFLIYLFLERFSSSVIINTIVWTIWTLLAIFGVANMLFFTESVDIFKQFKEK